MGVYSNIQRTLLRITELNKLYGHYYSENKTCKYYPTCSQKPLHLGYNKGYHSSFAVSIGKNYDLNIDGIDIRILFVGKEGRNKNNKISPTKRLQEFEAEGKVNLHYREVYKMLCEMLSYNWINEKHKESNRYLYKPDANITCFALTNIYRCAFKENDRQVKNIFNSSEQNINCLKILKEEIKILQPTIIVLQKSNICAKSFDKNAELCIGTTNVYYSSIYNAYFIQTIHPSNYGKWYKTYKPEFSNAVNYLKSIKKLPLANRDTTIELNLIDKNHGELF